MTKVLVTMILTALAAVGLLWLALVVVARAGTIDVAATADEVPGVWWFFSTLSEQSIRRHAARALAAGEIKPPAEVTEAMLRTGASHYRSMCVVCHGAPGSAAGEIGRGMRPEPPELSRVARERSEAEIFWVIRHGIRHTGMPAFGPTHSEEELWAIAAFVERLDGMSPEEYARLAPAAGGDAAAESAGHAHDDHTHGDEEHGDHRH